MTMALQYTSEVSEDLVYHLSATLNYFAYEHELRGNIREFQDRSITRFGITGRVFRDAERIKDSRDFFELIDLHGLSSYEAEDVLRTSCSPLLVIFWGKGEGILREVTLRFMVDNPNYLFVQESGKTRSNRKSSVGLYVGVDAANLLIEEIAKRSKQNSKAGELPTGKRERIKKEKKRTRTNKKVATRDEQPKGTQKRSPRKSFHCPEKKTYCPSNKLQPGRKTNRVPLHRVSTLKTLKVNATVHDTLRKNVTQIEYELRVEKTADVRLRLWLEPDSFESNALTISLIGPRGNVDKRVVHENRREATFVLRAINGRVLARVERETLDFDNQDVNYSMECRSSLVSERLLGSRQDRIGVTKVATSYSTIALGKPRDLGGQEGYRNVQPPQQTKAKHDEQVESVGCEVGAILIALFAVLGWVWLMFQIPRC